MEALRQDRHRRGRQRPLAASRRGGRPREEAPADRVPRPPRLPRGVRPGARAPLAGRPCGRRPSRRSRRSASRRRSPSCGGSGRPATTWPGTPRRSGPWRGSARQDIAPKLLEIARTPGDPLAASALIGLGDLGSPEALPIVREALNSRRDEIVIAAARPPPELLARPALKDDGIRDRLAALLADADASPAVRQAALGALANLGDPRLGPTLTRLARDANLEGTPLLEEVELTLSKRNHRPSTQK